MITEVDQRESMIVDLDKSSLFVPFHISLMENQKYTATEKMVYLALKSFCINARACFPSQSKIMLRAGIKSNKTLTTTLQSLESKGVILIAPEFDNHGKRKSNTYYLAKYDIETGDFDSSSLESLMFKKKLGDEKAKESKQGSRKGKTKDNESEIA